ncbi:MAG: GerMN domain-containing protein [Chroococcidiopsidaceae cyanobacterium CP_BM_RX_35]|nr:GerMN domain-containing protein [Chroococcidiopsidaceae cyanobacterium CP_BM_RX_35]
MVKQRTDRIPRGVVVGIVAAMVAAGGGAAWWTVHSANSPTNPPPPTTTTLPPPTSPLRSPLAAKAEIQTAQVYWLKDTDKHLELVKSSVKLKAANQPDAVLAAAFNRLLAGPTDAGVSSTIPRGTKLRDVKTKSDGVHVNLSQEFTSGGGSDSMTGRIGQVLYTATSLEPSAKVWISVEGKPLTVLGGEGLELEQPLTRQGFQQNFSL